MFRNRQREQRSKKLHGFLDRKSVLAEFLCQYRQFFFRGIVGLPWQYTLKKVNNRIECRVLIVR
jgi:hypothetical protein